MINRLGLALVLVLLPGAFSAAVCRDGEFRKSDGKCERCSEGCLRCTNIDDKPNCIDCARGLALDVRGPQGVCFRCAKRCLACTGPSVKECAELEKGFAFDRNRQNIFPCPTGCRYCSAPNVCSSCNYGYFLRRDRCLECPADCGECDESRSCKKCNPGFTKVYGGCKRCSENCEECDSRGMCTRCRKGSLLRSGRCQTIRSCVRLDGESCAECARGYYLSNKGCRSCREVQEGCIECNATSCSNCMSRDYVAFINNIGVRGGRNGDKCFVCPRFCTKCSDERTCNTCEPGYLLSRGRCTRAIPDCLYYDNNELCRECNSTYFLSRDRKACVDGKCRYGSGLNSENKCVECMPNCASCDMRTGKCVRAADGYRITPNGVVACPKGCESCANEQGEFECEVVNPLVNVGLQVLNRDPANPKPAEYVCHESCTKCYRAQDPSACGLCRPGLFLAKSNDGGNYCIDENQHCKRPQALYRRLSYCQEYDPKAQENTNSGSQASNQANSSK